MVAPGKNDSIIQMAVDGRFMRGARFKWKRREAAGTHSSVKIPDPIGYSEETRETKKCSHSTSEKANSRKLSEAEDEESKDSPAEERQPME